MSIHIGGYKMPSKTKELNEYKQYAAENEREYPLKKEKTGIKKMPKSETPQRKTKSGNLKALIISTNESV